MKHLVGIISLEKGDCQKLIDKAWAEMLKGDLPPNTDKPKSIKHPSDEKWVFAFHSEGFYFNIIKKTLTSTEIGEITKIGTDWIG